MRVQEKHLLVVDFCARYCEYADVEASPRPFQSEHELRQARGPMAVLAVVSRAPLPV